MHCCPGKSALKETTSKQRAVKSPSSFDKQKACSAWPGSPKHPLRKVCTPQDVFAHLHLSPETDYFMNPRYEQFSKSQTLRFPLSFLCSSSSENSWDSATQHNSTQISTLWHSKPWRLPQVFYSKWPELFFHIKIRSLHFKKLCWSKQAHYFLGKRLQCLPS